MQTVAYSILWDLHFLLRNFALIGALLLVLADSEVESRPLLAGVPSLGKCFCIIYTYIITGIIIFFFYSGENKQKNYMQLTGRCLIAFMFITLLKFELNFFQV